MYAKINDNEKCVLYKPLISRFYILLTFSLFNFLCGFLYNAWGPLVVSINQLYKWDLTETNLQANFFAIAYCAFVAPIIYIWSKKGIKFIYFVSATIIVIGTIIRLYPCSIPVQSIIIQIGSSLIGLGAVMSLIAPPVISMLWFPYGERARATALPIAFNTLGTALAPIIASQFVPTIDINQTAIESSLVLIENGIQKYLYLHSVMAIAVLMMIIIYFPSKPSISPCKSSDASLRLNLWSGIKTLRKKKPFWIVFWVNMIVYGFNSAISAVAITFLIPMGISQKEAGVVSFVVNVLSFVSCIFGGWLGDKISHKHIILASVPPTLILYIVTGLQCLKIIPHDLLSVYINIVPRSLLTNFACPASFEMGVEAAFPVSEVVSTAVISFATNIGVMLFLSVCMIPKIGTTWIPFSYAFLSLFLIPLMWFYKDERNRKKCYDIFVEEDANEINSINNICIISNESGIKND